ncbi:lysylphosphatidylglycerol synthase domain-containing protein [Cellulomonas palmilytica]|uniref:lysylphosphatidylglycerol synthase domain-containing protein n=1 Tax=Cellulomonas palmilytica TaxID=2608402 RepID=UPI001F443256|nr:lysylphosphatidylglycerol synthase domain-containing protein [Cellulomonas palmilytica]
MSAPEPDVPAADGSRAWWRGRAVRAGAWVVVAACAWFAVQRLVGAVDWRAVADAFTHVPAAVVGPLVGLLLVRQALNAVPLACYVENLSLSRSLQNDLAAYLVGSFTPPPADMAVRVAMFRAWRVDSAQGLAGVGLNTATFYAVRFGVPVVGVALLALGDGVERRQVVATVLCALVAAACFVALALLLRSAALAAWMGRSAARVVARVRRGVDPESWAVYLTDLRERTADRLRTGLVPSLLALLGMVVVDGLMLHVTLRAVGVPASALSLVDVLAVFLVAYPLTLLPLFGLGVMDAVLVGAWTTVAGAAFEPDLVAATLAWRALTLVGPLLMGLVVVAAWRWRDRDGATTDVGAR